ncbi:MAG: hypothetical protein V1936_01390 [Patescibacteria group bacterium]
MENSRNILREVIETSFDLALELEKKVKVLSNKQVKAIGVKALAKKFVRVYFGELRPKLLNIEFDTIDLDDDMQTLLDHSNASSAKSSYLNVINRIKNHFLFAEKSLEMFFSDASNSKDHHAFSDKEQKILSTLEKINLSAANSFRQALFDLNERERISFKGPTHELRESLRETLDTLAPDKEVTAQQNFQLEDGQKKPTMAQKTRFIFKSRGEKLNKVDELIRPIYGRSSNSAHVANTRREALSIKGYIELMLCDLLEID